MPAWKRQVPRKTSPVGYAWEVRWEDLNGIDRQKVFPIKADDPKRTDTRGRLIKPRPIERIADAVEKEAARFCVQIDLELAQGKSTAPMAGKGKRFREVAEQMLVASAHRLEDKTFDGYEDQLRLHIYDAFGERRISQISSLDVEKWWAAMQVKLKPKSNPDAPDELYAPSSLNGILTTLGRVFHHAQKHQLITVNPCDAVDRIKMDHTEVEFYDPHEIAALLDYLDLTPPYGLIVRFACKTGLRPGELEALRIGDIKHVNFQRGHVEVVRQRQHTTKRGWKEKRTKTSAANRKVPLPPSLLSELRDHLAQHPHHDDPDALLWPGRDKGGDIRHNLTPEGADRRLNYNKALRCEGVYRSHVVPALEALGLRKLPWYSFRHFYASWSAAQGYQIETVAKRLGHSNLQIMYKHYLHLFSDHDDMSRLDALDTVAPVQRIPSLGVRGVV